MWRLTSADKGRTDAAASFRHGGKNQTGVALAAKVVPGAATDNPSCAFRQSDSGCRCFPSQTNTQTTTLFWIFFFLMMLHMFFSHSLSLSLSLLVFHPRLQVTNKSLNSVSSEAFSLIKSFKFWCSQMSAACCLRMWAMLEELKALCLSHTGLVFYSIARQTQWD